MYPSVSFLITLVGNILRVQVRKSVNRGESLGKFRNFIAGLGASSGHEKSRPSYDSEPVSFMAVCRVQLYELLGMMDGGLLRRCVLAAGTARARAAAAPDIADQLIKAARR